MALHNPKRPTYVALLLSFAVVGCTVGKNYERPDLASPAKFRYLDAAQAESLADAPWFQVFDDAALQALIKEALTGNLDIKIALARVEEARARAGIAKSFFYPQVDGIATYTARLATTSDDDAAHQAGTYGFQLSWEIDLFGRLRRQNEIG